MELILPPELQRFVDEKVSSGRYASPGEVLVAGLARLMQNEWIESLSTAELEAIYPDLRSKIAEGIADSDAGRVVDGEAFFDELDREDAESDGDRKTA